MYIIILSANINDDRQQLEDVHKWKNRKHLVLDVDETLGHAFIGESCLKELKNSGIYDVPIIWSIGTGFASFK